MGKISSKSKRVNSVPKDISQATISRRKKNQPSKSKLKNKAKISKPKGIRLSHKKRLKSTQSGDEDDDSDTSERPWDSASEGEEEECPENDSIPMWTEQITNHPVEYFLSRRGPRHDLPVGATEEDYTRLFLDDDFYISLAINTNKHAEYLQRTKNKTDSTWEPTTAQEIKAYIAIQIYMGIVKLPKMEDYFYGDFVSCPLVSSTMNYRRFSSIGKYLHLVDEETQLHDGPKDPLYKVKPVLDITPKFIDHFQPDCDLSVDEAMIGFNGRLGIKQYMPQKPTKWGIKVWAITETKSGYMLRMRIYLGKKEPERKDLLLGEQVVLDMTKPFIGTYHHIYFDNFFTSVRLMDMLEDQQLYSCGTIRTNRKDWPEDLKKPAALKLKTGETVQRQRGNLTATVYKDKRDVAILSNNCDPLGRVEKKRRSKTTGNISLKCPQPIVKYNQGMGGVDLADQYRSYYQIGRKSNKWWKYVFYFVIDIAIINAFILSSITNNPTNRGRPISQLEFRKNLVRQMIGNFDSRKRDRQSPQVIPTIDFSHQLVRISAKSCFQCAKEGRRTKSNGAIRTTWQCLTCHMALCKAPCYQEIHGFQMKESENSSNHET